MQMLKGLAIVIACVMVVAAGQRSLSWTSGTNEVTVRSRYACGTSGGSATGGQTTTSSGAPQTSGGSTGVGRSWAPRASSGCGSGAEGPEGELDFVLSGGNGPLSFEIKSKSLNGREDMSARMRWQLLELVEFVDANGDRMYTPGEGVKTMAMSQWGAFACDQGAGTCETTAVGGAPVRVRSRVGTTAFNVTGDYAGDVVAVPGGGIKFDISLLPGYTFANNQSRIAFTVQMQTQAQVRMQAGAKEDKVGFGTGGGLSWIKKAMLGNATHGVDKDVLVGTIPTAAQGQSSDGYGKYNATFSIDAVNPVQFTWDPVLESSTSVSDTTSAGSAPVPLSWLALGLAIFASVVVW